MVVKRYKKDHHPVMRFFVVIAVIAMLFPLAVILIWSFNLNWTYPEVIPDAWTFNGYITMLFGSTNFTEVVLTSICVTGCVCILCAVIGTLTAQAMVFYDFPGKNLVDFLIYLPCIVPSVVMGIGVHILFLRLGISGTYFGVIIAQTIISMPYAIKIIINATKLLGVKYTQQAIVLGSSPFKAYFQVSFRQLIPSIVSAMCMAFTASFSDYFLTLLIGAGRVETFAIAVVPLISGANTNLAAAYSVAYVGFAFVFFLVLEWLARRITKKQEQYLM